MCRHVRLRAGAAAFAIALGIPAAAAAQAWLPPPGEGLLTITYQGTSSDTHLNRDGGRVNPARITGNTVLLGFDYGLTERLALDAKVAWVANKYEGTDLLHGPVDTGSFHGTMQDARVALRYRLQPERRLAVTPFAGAVIPTHSYETRGHSAPGRHLRSLQLGLSVGRDLAVSAVDLYIQGQYAYSFVERVAGFDIDRSNADLEIGYAVMPRLTITAAAALQVTHGGLTFPLPRDEHFHDRNLIHDRVGKAGFVLFTSGGTFAVRREFDVYATAVWTVSGRNTHAIRGLSVGTAWTFGRRELTLTQRRHGLRGTHPKSAAASPGAVAVG